MDQEVQVATAAVGYHCETRVIVIVDGFHYIIPTEAIGSVGTTAAVASSISSSSTSNGTESKLGNDDNHLAMPPTRRIRTSSKTRVPEQVQAQNNAISTGSRTSSIRTKTSTQRIQKSRPRSATSANSKVRIAVVSKTEIEKQQQQRNMPHNLRRRRPVIDASTCASLTKDVDYLTATITTMPLLKSISTDDVISIGSVSSEDLPISQYKKRQQQYMSSKKRIEPPLREFDTGAVTETATTTKASNSNTNTVSAAPGPNFNSKIVPTVINLTEPAETKIVMTTTNFSDATVAVVDSKERLDEQVVLEVVPSLVHSTTSTKTTTKEAGLVPLSPMSNEIKDQKVPSLTTTKANIGDSQQLDRKQQLVSVPFHGGTNYLYRKRNQTKKEREQQLGCTVFVHFGEKGYFPARIVLPEDKCYRRTATTATSTTQVPEDKSDRMTPAKEDEEKLPSSLSSVDDACKRKNDVDAINDDLVTQVDCVTGQTLVCIEWESTHARLYVPLDSIDWIVSKNSQNDTKATAPSGHETTISRSLRKRKQKSEPTGNDDNEIAKADTCDAIPSRSIFEVQDTCTGSFLDECVSMSAKGLKKQKRTLSTTCTTRKRKCPNDGNDLSYTKKSNEMETTAEKNTKLDNKRNVAKGDSNLVLASSLPITARNNTGSSSETTYSQSMRQKTPLPDISTNKKHIGLNDTPTSTTENSNHIERHQRNIIDKTEHSKRKRGRNSSKKCPVLRVVNEFTNDQHQLTSDSPSTAMSSSSSISSAFDKNSMSSGTNMVTNNCHIAHNEAFRTSASRSHKPKHPEVVEDLARQQGNSTTVVIPIPEVQSRKPNAQVNAVQVKPTQSSKTLWSNSLVLEVTEALKSFRFRSDDFNLTKCQPPYQKPLENSQVGGLNVLLCTVGKLDSTMKNNGQLVFDAPTFLHPSSTSTTEYDHAIAIQNENSVLQSQNYWRCLCAYVGAIAMITGVVMSNFFH